MASSMCITRLRKELKEIQKKPVENIRTAPRENNMLEWHYVIEGPKNSLYSGGWYHGTVVFPQDYPYKPPSIQMFTPNGRFKTNTKLCLSMSDFHPESWNPVWSVGTILLGLYSFMLEETPTHGSITTTNMFKREAAKKSLEFNSKNKIFSELFPELVELHKEQLKSISDSATGVSGRTGDTVSGGTADSQLEQHTSWAAVLGMFAAIVACTWALLALAL